MSQAASATSSLAEGASALRKESRYGASCFECRRRKVKCLPSANNPSKCKACVRRGSKCVEQELAPARVGAAHRKKLSERIGRLEGLIQTLREEGNGRITEAMIQDALKSEDASVFARRSVSSRSNSPDDGTRFIVDDEASPQSERGRNDLIKPNAPRLAVDSLSLLDILTPSGVFKHQKICRILSKVLQGTPNVENALNHHSQFWKAMMQRHNPDASYGEINLKEYARLAIAGDNPIKIARVLQIAAAGVDDYELFQKLVALVDRLIVCDDEYMSSMEGLECAFEHGRFYVELGEIRRSFFHIRKMVSYLELMGLGHNQNNPREDWLWRMVYQTERFMSLLVQSPSTASNIHCKVTFDHQEVAYNPLRSKHDGMIRLAVLSGKVLDATQSTGERAYDTVMDIDRELDQFASSLTSLPFEEPPVPFPHKDGKGTMKEVEKSLMQLHLFQAKLMLHMPWMLKSTTDPNLEYSRSSCFEAARGGVKLFLAHRRQEVTESLASYKTSPADWMGFVAAACLIIGQIGYTFNVLQQAEDQRLVENIIGLYKKIPTKFARQSFAVLEELRGLRDSPSRDLSKPAKITLPILGEIIIPSARGNMASTSAGQTITATWIQSQTSTVSVQQGGFFATSSPGRIENDLMGRIPMHTIYTPYTVDNSYFIQQMPLPATGLSFASAPMVSHLPTGAWQDVFQTTQSFQAYQEPNSFSLNVPNNMFNP